MKPARVEHLVRLADEQWDAAVAASGRPFRFSHRASAGRALDAAYASYRFEPCRVEYRDGASILFPLVRVARRLDSLAMVLGMPLGLEGTPIALAGETSLAHVRGLFRALPARGRLDLYGGAGGSPPSTGRETSMITHTLDLRPGFEALWERSFSTKNRNSCRKAERAGVEVHQDSTAEGAEAYRALYEGAARSWGYAEPPYPHGLFTALHESGSAELWLARLDGRPVAGALLLGGSDDLLYWSGAMDRDFQGVAPSNAVIRAAIESACGRGVGYFDFGASSGLSGVERFKASFGAEPRHYRSVELCSRRYRSFEWWHRRLPGRGTAA